MDIPITKLKIVKAEIAQVKWFKKEDLLQQIEEKPDEFLENLNEYVNLFSK